MTDMPIEIRLRAAYLHGAMEELNNICEQGANGATYEQIADFIAVRIQALKAEAAGLCGLFAPNDNQPAN